MLVPEYVTIVGVTGGPCAGKSSVLSAGRRRIENSGRAAYVLKETATDLIEAGIKLKQAVAAQDWAKVRKYQRIIMRVQYAKEMSLIESIVMEGEPAVLFVDRPIADGCAYLPEGPDGDNMWSELAHEIGLTPHQVLSRYHGVIKMTTAALDAEEFYTCANNEARDEPTELARYLDQRIEQVYLAHPHLAIIDNSTDFEEKKKRALQALCRIAGIPEPLEIERKYEIEYPCFPHFPMHRTVEIEQIYLLADNLREEVRVRRRTWGSSSIYYMTKKIEIMPGKRIETEKMIDWETYYRLAEARDTSRGIVRKNRTCFLWKSQHFELDVFNNLDRALSILEIEVPDLDHKPELPPFIRVIKEVTENPEYKTHALALRAKSV